MVNYPDCTTLDTVDPPTIVVREGRVILMWVIWVECVGVCPILYDDVIGVHPGKCINLDGDYRIHTRVVPLHSVLNDYIDKRKIEKYNACQRSLQAAGMAQDVEGCCKEAGISINDPQELTDPRKVDGMFPPMVDTDGYDKSRCFCNWPESSEDLTFGGGRRSHPEHEQVKALQNKMAASFKEAQDKGGNSIFLFS
tara:strand:- start:441 stop:1028 length:588 start_codon:yes stop_codon:yes gene_type:complete